MKDINVTIRTASFEDITAIELLMKHSMRILGKGYYSESQIDSCCQFVCVPDCQLIEDKTYFIALTRDKKIVGCGGWSFRNKLYAGPKQDSPKEDKLDCSTDPARIRAMFTDPSFICMGIGSQILDYAEKAAHKYGFTKAVLGSTLSALSFYTLKGWCSLFEEQAVFPNGLSIKVVQMEKGLC